jgi:hypothetical protein
MQEADEILRPMADYYLPRGAVQGSFVDVVSQGREVVGAWNSLWLPLRYRIMVAIILDTIFSLLVT